MTMDTLLEATFALLSPDSGSPDGQDLLRPSAVGINCSTTSAAPASVEGMSRAMIVRWRLGSAYSGSGQPNSINMARSISKWPAHSPSIYAKADRVPRRSGQGNLWVDDSSSLSKLGSMIATPLVRSDSWRFVPFVCQHPQRC